METDRENYYSVPEVARVLGVSQTRVRQLIKEEELEAERDEKGWLVAKHVVHTFKETYAPRRSGQDPVPALSQEALLAFERVESLQRELGRIEGRLELEAVARSTLEEQLRREQIRVDQERERAEQERQERIQAHEEASKLREELEAARQEAHRSWWQRIFGR
jgi:excisionase family DNA binding protein